MGQILLDNASRGSTTLLSECVPPVTSDQISAGTTPGDDTGDEPFNGFRKIKQWAADTNAMMTDLFGVANAVTATVPSGNTDSYDPSGYAAGVTARMLLTPTDNTSTLLGLPAAPDGWRMRIFNLSANYTLSFSNDASSTSGNSFFCPGGNTVVLDVQQSAWIEYVATINGWMFL